MSMSPAWSKTSPTNLSQRYPFGQVHQSYVVAADYYSGNILESTMRTALAKGSWLQQRAMLLPDRIHKAFVCVLMHSLALSTIK